MSFFRECKKGERGLIGVLNSFLFVWKAQKLDLDAFEHSFLLLLKFPNWNVINRMKFLKITSWVKIILFIYMLVFKENVSLKVVLFNQIIEVCNDVSGNCIGLMWNCILHCVKLGSYVQNLSHEILLFLLYKMFFLSII